MRKRIIWIAGIVVAIAVLGAGAVAYNEYRRTRSRFDEHREKVRRTVKAIEDEDANAEEMYRTTKYVIGEPDSWGPWVSAAEVQGQLDELERAREKAGKKYPVKALVWKLGESYTWAVITCQFSKSSDDYLKWFRRANALAWLADVSLGLSEFDFQYQKKDPKEKQQFVREHLDKFAAEIGSQHGTDNRKLFHMASLAVLAFMASTGRDAFPEQSKSYPDEIATLGKETAMPEKLWRPYVTALENKAPPDAVNAALADMLNAMTAHLGGLATK